MKIIKIDKKYFRPNEVENLIGDFSKSKKVLNWKPKTTIEDLIKEMIDYDIGNSKKLLK